MSARVRPPIHPESVQACTFQALRAVVYRIGIAETARYLPGAPNESTVRRTMADNTWEARDVIEIKRLERDVLGTRTIHEAESAGLYGKAVGEAVRVEAEISQQIGEQAELIADANAMLRDGHADPEEVRKHLPMLEAHIAHCEKLVFDMKAKLGRPR